jgi:diguanylate cyclase (GGDEF)-like protein
MSKVVHIFGLQALALCLALGQTVSAQLAHSAQSVPSARLTSTVQVKALTNQQAAKAIPVLFEATVTYARPSEKNLFVMEQGAGIYVRFGQDIGLAPGDRIEITGTTAASFRPIVDASKVQFLRHGEPPPAQPAKFEDLIRAKWDSQRVEIRGHVLSAATAETEQYHNLRVRVSMPQGIVEGIVAHAGKLRPEELLDSDIRMVGVAGGAFDSRMQMAGVWIDVFSWQDIEILHRPEADPWSMPITLPSEVIFSYRNSNASGRVRISGTLTYFEPGALAVVEHDGIAMLVETRSSLPLHAGVGVEATGFPAVTGENVHLESAQLRPAEQGSQVEPRTIQWEGASVGQYAYNLVAMEGNVVAEAHDSRMDMYVIDSGGHLYSATMRHSSADAHSAIGDTADAAEARAISVGSRVRTTGVCFVESGNHWRDRLWFDLRMRSMKDIVVIQAPAWWTVQRLAYAVALLALAILCAVSWVWLLRRRVRQQTAEIARRSEEESARERRLARLEQQRSEILEMISGGVPLVDVLRRIEWMVSSRLEDATCWFELNPAVVGGHSGQPAHELNHSEPNPAGNPSAGSPSRSMTNFVYQPLSAPDGAKLGSLMAMPPLQGAEDADLRAALMAGARLAELAIETGRLYADLRHRSEYDLLTDVPNRFSMENELGRLMQKAHRDQSIFGLIYVDLDRFKLVNDTYGHRTGDLYLKEVTRRMKLQLRNGDTLARIGGDEFIALTPILRSRADAEEIALRLERCFDEHFRLDGYIFRGSASVGLAVYPEDGASQEELQRSADAAMYAHKQQKRCAESLDPDSQSHLTAK